MGRMFDRIVMTLCCTLILAASAQAKLPCEVYLKDGGVIKCQKAWPSEGKVLVLINRDTLLDFSKDEVNLQETFGKKPAKPVKKAKTKKKIKAGVAAKRMTAPKTAAKSVAKPAATEKRAPATVPVKSATPAIAKPAVLQPGQVAVKPAPSPAVQAAKKVPPPAGQQSAAVKPPVQAPATPAKNPAPVVSSPPGQMQRPPLAVVHPAPPPPPEKSFLEKNLTNIGLGGLLILLVALYVVQKKRKQG